MAYEYPCQFCGNPITERNFCSVECTTASVDPDDIRRFFQSIARDEKTGCWVWLGAVNQGYPVISINGRTTLARRFAAKAFIGVDYGNGAPAIKVYAACQSAGCVSPQHIIWQSPVTPTMQFANFARKYGIPMAPVSVDEARVRMLDASNPGDPRLPRCRRCRVPHGLEIRYCMSQHARDAKVREFEESIQKESGHWMWKGKISRIGKPFGFIAINSRQVPATRFALAFFMGGGTDFTLDSPKVVRRKPECSEDLCVNPAHLEAVVKGSWNLPGSLTDEERADLRAERKMHGYSYKKLAEYYHISPMTARKIVLAGAEG